MISVFGNSGFIGSRFCQMYRDEVTKIPREIRTPKSNNILNFISTTDNYNVFENPTLDVETNVIIMLEILENAKEIYGNDFTFTQISSWFVYGAVELPAREDSFCDPKGFYSISKLMAEKLLISYCETHGINYKILRLCNVIGETDSGVSKKKNALQYLIDQMKQNKNISLYHGGKFFRDYMYVDDVVFAIKLCVDNLPNNEIINVGGGVGLNFYHLINYCKEKLHSTSEFIAVEPSEFHKKVQVKNMYLDVSKLKKLGFEQKYSIWEALDKICG